MRGPIRCRGKRAFTLAEVVVVVAIIVLLMATLLPMMNRARVAAKRARLAMDLNTIGIALDAYRDDFGDYPRPTETNYDNQRGAAVLCRALLAPENATGDLGDGADGYGFRIRRNGATPQGKVYGPYLRPESFKVRRNQKTNEHDYNVYQLLMLDIDDQPILYYPARATKPNIHLPEGFVALALVSTSSSQEGGPPPLAPLFNVYDNSGPYPDGLYRMRLMLGDVSLDGAIDANETPASTGPYLLWSAGPDGYYGPVPGPDGDPRPLSLEQRRKLRSKVDDVTNFQFR